jgi:hypothetical protein
MAKSQRLKKHVHTLKVLHDCTGKTRKAILQNADKELIDCICLCLDNILKGNVKVPPSTYKKLKRQQGLISELHKKSVGTRKKNQLLIQSGGFLPALLAPILGIVGSLIGNLVG